MRATFVLAVATLCPTLSLAQAGYGTLNLETRLGSFKIKRFNLASPAEGKIEISFNGTLLIAGYKGKPFEPTMKGLRIEFPDPKVLPAYNSQNFEKVVLQGKGSVVLDGKFMALQWFGRDMKARWHGKGVIYLFGEFDENERTGTHWTTDPTKKKPWLMPNERIEIPGAELGLGGRGIPVPRPKPGDPPVKPPPKKAGG